MPGQLSSSDAPLSSLLPSQTWGPGPVPVHPFHFRTRSEPVDWRRIAALDVDRVAREMDIGLLQEHITGVTFCDVSGERCPHCRGPVDPTMVKILLMSQFSTEYLLHCQDYLSAQLASLEERLQGALAAAEREAEEKAKLDAELQAERLENKRRKKMIATQQLLLQAAANNYHKCQFCEKSFINYSYLQAHQQRRHPEATEAEKQKKKQIEQVEDGIEELRERLSLSQAALAAEKEAEALRRNQELEEQRRREASERQELDRWKDEERRKVYQEMSDFKQLFMQELKHISSKSSSVEATVEAIKRSEVPMTEIHTSRDQEELERAEAREKVLRGKLVSQKSEWKNRVKELQNIHELDKVELLKENERLRQAEDLSSELQQQIDTLTAQLRSKERLIHAQEQKIKKMSAKPTSVPAPPVRQDALVSSEEEEVEEEEEEDEDEDEDEDAILKQLEARRLHREALKKNPNLLRDFRSILQDSLEVRLEDLGLRKKTKGISKQTLKSLTIKVAAERQKKVRQDPGLQALREKIQAELDHRLSRAQKSQSISKATNQSQKLKVTAGLSKEKNTKPKQTTVPKRGKSPAPQPTPRLKLLQTPHPKVKKSSTPPFSSEEESIVDSAYRSSPSRPTPSVRLVQSGPQQSHNPLSGPSSAPTDDWSDSDLSEEVAGTSTKQGASMQGSVVQTLTRSLERQLTSPMSKPVGGVRVIPPTNKSTPQSKSVVKKLQLSDEDSDLELSSIEEVSAEPIGVRRTTDIGGPSVWSSSASRPGGWANP